MFTVNKEMHKKLILDTNFSVQKWLSIVKKYDIKTIYVRSGSLYLRVGEGEFELFDEGTILVREIKAVLDVNHSDAIKFCMDLLDHIEFKEI